MINETLHIGQGDTRTAIKAILKSPKGNPINLTGATVNFKMVRYKTTLIDREAIVLDRENGVVAFIFKEGETDEVGKMLARFKVTYNDSTIETFPNGDKFIKIQINSDL